MTVRSGSGGTRLSGSLSVNVDGGTNEATWWPSLPQCPILGEFGEQRQNNVVVFQPEVGRPKFRKRSTRSHTLTAVAFRMTGAQVRDFNDFYKTYTSSGTDLFLWDHPITKKQFTWMFSPSDAPKIDRFAPDRFRVSFSLIRLDGQVGTDL